MSECDPCPSVARAILGAVDEPDGVLLRCGKRAGHDMPHEFLMQWTDPAPNTGGLIADQIASYLASRRDDPAFRHRLAKRLVEDAEILRRLSADDGSFPPDPPPTAAMEAKHPRPAMREVEPEEAS